MTYRKLFIFLCIALFSFASSTLAQGKSNISVTKVNNTTINEIRIRPSLSTADTCILRHDQGIVFRINGWVVGNELYKSYLDPSVGCPTPYPFTITEINMPMIFNDSTTMTVSVDVERVDYSNPNCPFPDTVMLGISSAYTITIPNAGIYELWIPLDQPIIVNEPFFAGFFIGEITNPLCSASVVIDDNLSTICMSYNVWDDTLGFIDLNNNEFFNFPGQLVLYASGITGGNSLEPTPQVSLLSPAMNDSLYKTVEIWVNENSGSSIIDYVSFAYESGANYIEIGRDYDGTQAFRDGVTTGNGGNGYSLNWDFSTVAAVTEGIYNIKVTAVDTLGREASEIFSIFLEPTPPIGTITSPVNEAVFCPSFDILMSSKDENLSTISLGYKRAEPDFSINSQTLLLSDFGDFYSPAVAAALAVEVLSNRGYSYIMRDGFNTLTVAQMTTHLAGFMNIVQNSGASDESIYQGLKTFNSTVGSTIDLNYQRFPNYLDLRSKIEFNGQVMMIGLGGTSNSWLLIDGFNGNKLLNGSYQIKISNPLTASIEIVELRNLNVGCEIFYEGAWQPLEIAITMSVPGWNKELVNFGADFNRADGWSFNWTPPNLWQNYYYFIETKGFDQTGMSGFDVTMLQYDCTQFYAAGDFNNDGVADILDLDLLIVYFTTHGPPPIGGDARADTNCDGYLNITDIVYFANFIFGAAATPCY